MKKYELLNDILDETKESFKVFVTSIKPAEKKKEYSFKVTSDLCIPTDDRWNDLELRSGATSLFDVQRWAFDVGSSALICPTFILQNSPIRHKCNL